MMYSRLVLGIKYSTVNIRLKRREPSLTYIPKQYFKNKNDLERPK